MNHSFIIILFQKSITEQVKNREIYQISKRFYPGGKDTGKKVITEAAKKLESGGSHLSNIHPISVHRPEPSKDISNSSAQNVVSKSPMNSNNNNNNNQPSNFMPKDLGSTADKIPPGMSPGRYLFGNKISDPTLPVQTIPTPPVQPPLPKILPNLVKESHTQQIVELAKNKESSESILKPCEIFKSKTGKQFETNITANTTSKDISDTELFSEMKKRELIKEDLGETFSKILTIDDTSITLGQPVNKVKLSSLGQAYASQVSNKDISNTKLPEDSNYEYKIVAPIVNNDKVFIETANLKHLLVACHIVTNEMFALGYLTSKQGSTKHLSNMQYTKFQNQQENKEDKDMENKQVKPQQLCGYNNAKQINIKDIVVVKYSKEYLQLINQNKIFQDILIEQRTKFIEKFNTEGLTKDDCVKMCIEHDKAVKSQKPHPLTDDQIKQQEFAKQNQKEQQLQKVSKIKKDENSFKDL
jgi:hypothetical protein